MKRGALFSHSIPFQQHPTTRAITALIASSFETQTLWKIISEMHTSTWMLIKAKEPSEQTKSMTDRQPEMLFLLFGRLPSALWNDSQNIPDSLKHWKIFTSVRCLRNMPLWAVVFLHYRYLLKALNSWLLLYFIAVYLNLTLWLTTQFPLLRNGFCPHDVPWDPRIKSAHAFQNLFSPLKDIGGVNTVSP